MDNPTIKEPREPVPDFARTLAVPGSPGGMIGPKITDKQRDYLLSLIEKKHVEHGGKMDLVMKCLRISEDPEEFGMSKAAASTLITWFEKQKDKPILRTSKNSLPTPEELPAGRYAVNADNGELRFYRLWRGTRNEHVVRLYVQHGTDESKVDHFKTVLGICRKIVTDGPRVAAIRYGMEIGACSNCGRRLTNRISRELGIGPVCGGRMFGDDFSGMVSQKRSDIVARGLDPDEELE